MAKPMNKVFKAFGGAKAFGIEVEQERSNRGLFTVIYGLQVKEGLGYDAACLEIGSCILHYLASNGMVNNEGEP